MRCHLALVALAAVSALVGGLPAIGVSSEVNGKPAECGVCKVVMQKVMSDASVSGSHECETTTWSHARVTWCWPQPDCPRVDIVCTRMSEGWRMRALLTLLSDQNDELMCVLLCAEQHGWCV
jgi:hypothetical protein